jgi:uncharacterized protein YecE (DUF72 family)
LLIRDVIPSSVDVFECAKTLRRWAEAVRRWESERRDVFVYFANDQKAAAPRDAQSPSRMIGW